MIDITKDEFLGNEEVIKKEKRVRGVRRYILKHKIFFGLVVILGIMIVVNIALIYNFYRILINI